jgi:hypothetical protein
MSSLRILVVEDVPVRVAEEPDQMEDHGIKEAIGRFRRRVTTSKADLEKLAGDLEAVQSGVEALLAGRTEHEVGGMKLNEVQVSLGISASGSIGVVTAGMEASITLSYSRSA